MLSRQTTSLRIAANFSLPRELVEQIRDFAAARRLPQSHIVQIALERELARVGWSAPGAHAHSAPGVQAQALEAR